LNLSQKKCSGRFEYVYKQSEGKKQSCIFSANQLKENTAQELTRIHSKHQREGSFQITALVKIQGNLTCCS